MGNKTGFHTCVYAQQMANDKVTIVKQLIFSWSPCVVRIDLDSVCARNSYYTLNKYNVASYHYCFKTSHTKFFYQPSNQ